MTWFWLILSLSVVGIVSVVWIFVNRRKRFTFNHGQSDGEIVLHTENVRMVAFSDGIPTGLGFKSGKGVRMRASLLVTLDRFVLVTRFGKIVDLMKGSERKLNSVRCNAPGRLIVEGSIPQIGRGDGLYRLELNFAEAKQWEVALQPFTETSPSKAFFS